MFLEKPVFYHTEEGVVIGGFGRVLSRLGTPAEGDAPTLL
jgi:hypothetical protein